MHLFECEATFEAEPAEVWKVWTDVARWPEWDVGKEIARLDGPFQPGVSGWAKQRGNLGGSFTITAVDDGRRWATECPMPLGKVVFDHLLEPVTGGRDLARDNPAFLPDLASALNNLGNHYSAAHLWRRIIEALAMTTLRRPSSLTRRTRCSG
jgi:hypothetical protein